MKMLSSLGDHRLDVKACLDLPFMCFMTGNTTRFTVYSVSGANVRVVVTWTGYSSVLPSVVSLVAFSQLGQTCPACCGHHVYCSK